MIYIVSLCSKILKDFTSLKTIHDDIEKKITEKDKVIIVSSSFKDQSTSELEKILKLNIDIKQSTLDAILSLKELESAYYIKMLLEKDNISSSVLTPYQIPILINNEEIEFIEMNNILMALSKTKYLIIPGNFGINKHLIPIILDIDHAEITSLYIYKELIKRRLKTICHIYYELDKIPKFDENMNITDSYEDNITINNIHSLSAIFNKSTQQFIKENKLKFTIGNTLFQGTHVFC